MKWLIHSFCWINWEFITFFAFFPLCTCTTNFFIHSPDGLLRCFLVWDIMTKVAINIWHFIWHYFSLLLRENCWVVQLSICVTLKESFKVWYNWLHIHFCVLCVGVDSFSFPYGYRITTCWEYCPFSIELP